MQTNIKQKNKLPDRKTNKQEKDKQANIQTSKQTISKMTGQKRKQINRQTASYNKTSLVSRTAQR